MLALEGIKILDFSLAMMGPLSTMMLGDMGAEVIKVERIQGEEIRKGRGAGTDASFTKEQMDELLKQEELLPDSVRWMANNRSKRSLAIDIRQEKGKELILKLTKDTDVVIHNFRPGTMDKLGLSYKDIVQINPSVIYCTIYGFGASGPLSHRIGGDLYTQALTGVVDQMGGPNVPPTIIPFIFVDHAGAMMTAYAITLALLHRQRTSEGQELWLNQTDVGMWLQASEMGGYLIDGQMIRKKTGRGGGYPPNGVFQTKDGNILVWVPPGPSWTQFCNLMGLEHLATDTRFEDAEARYEHMLELYTILDPIFLTRTRAEWQQVFRERRLRADPCLTYEEICVPHPQVEANEGIITIDHPTQGKIRMLGVPAKFTKTPGKPRRHPPLLGEHTKEIITELGYSGKEITELEELKIIKAYKPVKIP
ncbi:CaiB/BaiF CoA transferase family protein [Chloroflexota bacterium]